MDCWEFRQFSMYIKRLISCWMLCNSLAVLIAATCPLVSSQLGAKCLCMFHCLFGWWNSLLFDWSRLRHKNVPTLIKYPLAAQYQVASTAVRLIDTTASQLISPHQMSDEIGPVEHSDCHLPVKVISINDWAYTALLQWQAMLWSVFVEIGGK